MAEPISFLASLPQIQSAIRFAGDGSVRVQLEVPASERANVVPLIALNDCVLEVTIKVRVEESQSFGETEARSRTAKRPLGVVGSGLHDGANP
jgi:hypothetical protein